jgi:AraC-like DNA-binding protein
MDAPLPRVAPPTVTVVDIDEPALIGADIELLLQDGVPLPPRALRARRIVVRLGTAAVVSQSTDGRVRTHTRVAAGRLGYVVFDPRARGSVNGLPVRPGLLLMAAAGAPASFVTEANWTSLSFLLLPEDLRAHLSARGRGAEFRLPAGVEALDVGPARARRLFAWGRRLVTTAARHPALFNERMRASDALQVEMIETLLATLRGADPVETTRGERTRLAYSRIVERAEAFALARGDAALCVGDLCRAAAVSERTLENAFNEVVGLSPMAYLVRLRLHRVRRALLAGCPASTTVTAEALNWGFWHFGEFSRAYKTCFGELPSATLRRKPGSA